VRLHKGMRWLAVAPVVIAACTGLLLGTSQAAGASATSQVCAQAGTGYCLNDWGGAGRAGDTVAMYYNDNTNNNDFEIQFISGCVGPGGTSCAQIRYLGSNNNLCLAAETPSGAVGTTGVLGTCGNASQGGNGAALGVIQWVTDPSWCNVGHFQNGVGLENRYFTQKTGSAKYVQSGGAVGKAVNLIGVDDNTSSCWQGVS
jgi:hypothetical protein